MPSRSALGLFLVVGLTAVAQADVKLPAIISDNMVLQQDLADPIWGWADPGEEIVVSVGDQKQATKADEKGAWKVQLDKLKASAEPTTLTVKGKNTLVVKNVLVGEVWVGSGQSNMEWSVTLSANPQEEIAAANYPKIRLFIVPRATSGVPQIDVAFRPADNPQGKWHECTPQSVAHFSAVAYYFGRALHKQHGFPVGLIESAWGGTICEAWTSRGALEADESLAHLVKNRDAAVARYPDDLEKFQKVKMDYEAAVKAAKDAGKDPPKAPQPPGDPQQGPNLATHLYNGMIAPIVPFGIRGAIWYQGESNVSRAYQYRTLFPTMITDWRKQWGQGDFPFLFVQLANFLAEKPEPMDSMWAELREAQNMALKLSQTGQAVIIDIGDAKDIHPKNKQDVGARLALWANHYYGVKDEEYAGPTYVKQEIAGGKIKLHFSHLGGGLVAKGDGLKGFAIAGEDKKFVWADAQIEGDTIVVSSPKVEHPVAVRYAWADNPVCNLYNKAGLPASPFRTDDFLELTRNSK